MFGNQLANHHRQASLISSASSLEHSFTEHELTTAIRRHKTSNIVIGLTSDVSSSILRKVASSLLTTDLYFDSIEGPEERLILQQKKEYIEREESTLMHEIQKIQHRARHIFSTYPETESRLRELRRYRPFAMNRLNKAVYWYILVVYNLNDQESYKAALLHPNNPERLWKTHFGSNFGRIVVLKNYTQQLSNRCWEIGIELLEPEVVNVRLKKSLEEFNRFTGLQHILMPSFTFWNSMMLAVATYSTIGYGNITPKSRLGRLAAMLYAIMLMILHKLGHFFLLGLEYVWNHLIWLVKRCIEIQVFRRIMESVSCVKDAEKLKGKMKNESGMPVLLAVGVAFGWMFLCAAIFLQFEDDWDYFKSFYFFFCSLTTIGFGDVTPSRSEGTQKPVALFNYHLDMFLIFGFIIIGLSLVSMCVNKLEEIFEELLISMIEEYGGQAAGISGPDLKPKLTVFDLWKMWKRRQKRNRPQREIIQQEQQQRKLLAEFNFWKIFPFAKRRREVLLHEFRNRLQQTSKATQTEQYIHSLHTLNYVQELDELRTSTSESDVAVEHSPNPTTSSTSASSNSSAKRVRVVLHEGSSSSPSFLSSSSSSTYTRRYLPNRKSERRNTTFSNTTNTTYGGASVQSAPIDATNSRAVSPHSSALIQQYAGTRRWTFFEIGKTPRGAPRGLVPYMYFKRNAKTHETTELKRLIAEMDVRLQTCRSMVSACSRAASRASSSRPQEDKSSQK
ncbi:TWiK family of potassium channels protein 18 [Aphelenchoides besseyi]|nr:TWiK family of potassium channels protein 18 [Aphelenchoides besseyi]